MSEEKKADNFGWKESLWMVAVIVMTCVIVISWIWVITSVYSIGTCQQLQSANTAPGYQYQYNLWTGCRVHIPSGLWVPQTDLDKYILPDPTLVHLPKEFIK